MRGKEKILIVDDEPLNVKFFKASLSTGSYDCISAYNGAEALGKVKREKPDLILLDIMMPGIDGYDVTKRLKNDSETKDVPIILITALDGVDSKVKGLEAGADDFLNRPVNHAELMARVKSLLRLRQYQDQLRSRHPYEHPSVIPFDEKAYGHGKVDLPTILLVEDDDRDTRLIQMLLHGEPYEIRTTKNGEDALSLSLREKVDLILLDILLPGMDGFELARRLKDGEETRNIQIVGLTCLSDLQSKIRGLEVGFDEYLVKPINIHELRARMNALIKKKAYLDRLQFGYGSAVRSAITDRLTGLYNYAYLQHVFENEIKRSKRHQYPISLLLLDIDDFKGLNDRLGHLAGDEVLREFGRVIPGNIREIDLCFRYGGEKFVVLLPYIEEICARDIAERLRNVVSEHPFLPTGTTTPRRITVSVGIAVCPCHGFSKEELITGADNALCEAKGAGRNRVCVAKERPAPEDISMGRS